MSDLSHPLVSVIVPVYNDPDGIRQCISALQEQTYPENRYEVLVVDNDSTDNTREVIKEFDVQLFVEDEIQGSYAARNRGIENASGDVLAFTDADCTPEPQWIEAGVERLEETSADLIGGRVKFEFSEQPTASERFDASVNMRNDKSTRNGIAKTANVFVCRNVVSDVGLFPEHLRSGGDVYWTKKATEKGYKMAYGQDAIVHHPSRQLRELLLKQYRVGVGQIQVWNLDQRSAWKIMIFGAAQFPVKVLKYLLSNEPNGTDAINTSKDRQVKKGFDVVIVAVLSVLAMNVGRLLGLLRLA